LMVSGLSYMSTGTNITVSIEISVIGDVPVDVLGKLIGYGVLVRGSPTDKNPIPRYIQ